MPARLAPTLTRRTLRAGFDAALAALLLIAGASSVHNAAAENETRTLAFHHTHSGEDLTVTFKRSGRYDEDALKKLNHFLRDWRSQDQTTMDRRLFDILWEVYRDVDGKAPIQIVSAYRAPATNAMLRRRSAHSGVARASQHMLGHAMDFYIPGVQLEKIRIAGLRLQRGGVGFYPTSGSPFVHLDTGNVRHWPRMTYEQLARVFPNGRTVHLPSNGGPLPGYQLALADIQKRGDGDSVSLAKSKPGNLLASLFGAKSSDDEEETAAPAIATKPVPAPSLMAAATAAADPVPMPRAKPAMPAIQLASADPESVPLPRPKQIAAQRPDRRAETPADIINARGFWDDMPAPKQATPQQVAALTARQALARIGNDSSAQDDPAASESTFAKAMAYAPPRNSPVDRSHIVAASAPMPRSIRAAPPTRNAMVVNDVTTVIGKTSEQTGAVTNATRLSAAVIPEGHAWMRAMIVTPSLTTAMSTTIIGDGDMTLLRAHFAKPQSVVAMEFSDDPQAGLTSDQFSGPATARLPVTGFAMRTASLR